MKHDEFKRLVLHKALCPTTLEQLSDCGYQLQLSLTEYNICNDAPNTLLQVDVRREGDVDSFISRAVNARRKSRDEMVIDSAELVSTAAI